MRLFQMITGCVLFTMTLTACADKNVSSNVSTVAPQTTITEKTPTKATGVWIDVRSVEEFQAGHISGAINITNDDIAKQIASVEPNKQAPINVYCRSGRRAEVARQTLLGLGYTNVTNHGSYEDLVKQGIR